jgi:hypothetical protein
MYCETIQDRLAGNRTLVLSLLNLKNSVDEIRVLFAGTEPVIILMTTIMHDL